MLFAETNRLEHATHRSELASLKMHVRSLKTVLAALDHEIAELGRHTPLLAHKTRLMQSLVGVGPVTATALLAGNGLIVWNAQLEEGTVRVQGRTLRANGSPGALINFTPELPATAYPSPKVVVNASGRTAVVWTQCSAPQDLSIRTSATGTTGGAFSAPMRLSPRGDCGDTNGTSLAIDSVGKALVAWESNPVGDRIRIRMLFVEERAPADPFVCKVRE